MSFFFSVPPPEKRRGCPGVCVPRTEVAWFVSADGHRWLRGPFPPGQSEAFGMSLVWEKPQPRKEKPGREGKGREAAPCPKAGAVIVTPRSPCVPIASPTEEPGAQNAAPLFWGHRLGQDGGPPRCSVPPPRSFPII